MHSHLVLGGADFGAVSAVVVADLVHVGGRQAVRRQQLLHLRGHHVHRLAETLVLTGEIAVIICRPGQCRAGGG